MKVQNNKVPKTSWFKLSKYDVTKKFGLKEWEKQLSIRSEMWDCLNDDTNKFKEAAGLWIDKIKLNPVLSYPFEQGLEYKLEQQQVPELDEKCLYSVYSTPAINFWLPAHDSKLDDVWEACKLENKMRATKEQTDLAMTAVDLLYIERGVRFEEITHVVVDLTATDKQIIDDFKVWLSSYRKKIGYQANKKPFTDKNFKDWASSRVLPYIDLLLVCKADNLKITQKDLAELIFPDEFKADIEERIRRTTKPKAKWLMSDETIKALLAQLHNQLKN